MHHRRAGLLATFLVAGLLGVGSAQAATVARPGLDVTTTARVAPTKLPARGSAPVTLTITGHTTQSLSEGSNTLRLIEVVLDRQLTTDTTGLGRCKPDDLAGLQPSAARKRCGSALIGHGLRTETGQLVEQPPFELRHTILFFNGGGTVLAYENTTLSTAPGEHFPATAYPIGNGHRLKLPIGVGTASTATSFRFTLGRTWSYKGQKRSYLNGQCRTGSLKNRFTLKITGDGGAVSTVSETSTERCTKRS